MGDYRAHNKRRGPRPLAWTRPGRHWRWRRGMEVKEEFGSAPGEEARRAKQNVSFFCLFFLSSFVCVMGEGKERGEPPLGR